MKKYLLILLILFTACDNEPIEVIDEYAECKPSLDISALAPDENGLVEGDIIVDFNKGVALTNKLWDKPIIHYYYQKREQNGNNVIVGVDAEDEALYDSHIQDLGMKTGVLFIKHETRESLLKSSPNGIEIRKSFGNSSYLGMVGGVQRLLIGNTERYILQHELLHALGVGHEFTRSDRDEYLIIRYDNIMEKYWRQFEINPLSTDCGEFDIESIMMYPQFHLSQDPEIPTIELVSGGSYEMKTTLSQGDIATVRSLYNL